MSESSRGRFTITLGRSGQVVNRGRNASDIDASYRVSGSKRSVRDRLGSNGGSSSFSGSPYSNKRQREDSGITGLTTSGVDGAHISSRDLRHKLLKNFSRTSESSSNHQVMDLRDKLPRMQEPPLSRYDRPKQISESRERSMSGRVAESRESSMLGRSAESREGSFLGRTAESRGNSIWRGLPESRESSILERVPSRSSAETFAHMDSSRRAYSPWSLDDLRRRSPERITRSSLAFPPQRNFEEPQRRPGKQTYGVARAIPYMGKKDMLDGPRAIAASPFISSSTLPKYSARPPMPPIPPLLSQMAPPSGTVQNGPYNTDELQTVDGLLHSLGLGKYAISFKAEEVDMTSLRQMGENDLKELGIPMGPRKKILLALLPRSKRQP